MIKSVPHEGQFSEYIDSLVGKGQYWFTKAKIEKRAWFKPKCHEHCFMAVEPKIATLPNKK